MKSYAVLFIFVALVAGGIAFYASQQDWTTPNYAASPDSHLVIDGRSVPCSEVLHYTCDRNDEQVLEAIQPNVDEFLGEANLVTLTTSGRVSTPGAVEYGAQICSNRLWKASSAVFTRTQPDLPYFVSFTIWSIATQVLCPPSI